MTHKLENDYVAEVLPQEFQALSQAPKPQHLAVGGATPEHMALKARQVCLQQWMLDSSINDTEASGTMHLDPPSPYSKL